MTLFLTDKIQEAIDFLKANEPAEGYTVKFSGGKDSIVTYDLVRKAEVKHRVYYNFTTIDPPELTRFILKYYPEVKWLRPLRSFFEYVKRVGPPTKQKRWCCSKLKHRVLKGSKHIVLGVRAEESYKRARREKINLNTETKTIDYYPIFFWTEADIWDYIEMHKLPYPSLYDEGFSRLGCVVCPFICRKGVLELHKKRWHKIYVLFEKAVAEYYENKKEWYIEHGVYSAEQLLDAWYNNKKSIIKNKKKDLEVIIIELEIYTNGNTRHYKTFQKVS
ncbi:phosphoadenosine phosphosulfate reductase family protein [Thermodesulfovibrio sp. TK110]